METTIKALATKGDLEEFASDLTQEIEKMNSDLTQAIGKMNFDLTQGIRKLNFDLNLALAKSNTGLLKKNYDLIGWMAFFAIAQVAANAFIFWLFLKK